MNNNQIKDTKRIPAELIDFNWAACLLTFIWGTKYRAWETFLAIPLILIQMPLGLNWIILFIFQIYCGFKGNEWAYKQEWWKRPKDFRITQMKWAAVSLTLYITLPLLLLTLTAKFFQNPENFPELIHNSQCILAQKYLMDDLKNLNISKHSTSEELISKLNKHDNSEIYGNSIIVKSKNRNKLSEQYTLTIEKPLNFDCSINEKNCRAYYDFYFNKNHSEYPNHCTFYFSNNKRILPDEDTKPAIDKGYNIFKYL